jgi:hypothetical protein
MTRMLPTPADFKRLGLRVNCMLWKAHFTVLMRSDHGPACRSGFARRRLHHSQPPFTDIPVQRGHLVVGISSFSIVMRRGSMYVCLPTPPCV